MALATKCPSCGRRVPIPDGFTGGPVTCPHADCQQTFAVQAPKLPPEAMSLGDSGPRHRALTVPKTDGRPALLDRLPPSLLFSPVGFSIGGVVALLYGLVLLSVVSSLPKREDATALAANEAPIVENREPAAANARPAPTPAPTPEPDPKPKDKAATKPRAGLEPASPETPARPAAPGTASQPKPATKAAPTPPAAAPAPPALAAWGPLEGDPGDTQFREDGGAFSIKIPPKLHVLSPELGLRNAPRLLADAQGDFSAIVTVEGRILPGTTPLPNLPFTFQGAGLLVWQDENNFLRVERIATYAADRRLRHQVFVEYCEEGHTASTTVRDAREADLTLKVERKGDEIRAYYSNDVGRNWLEVKRLSVSFPAVARVGISASNASPKPFSAEFRGFKLEP